MTIIRAAASVDEVADLWTTLAEHHYAVAASVGSLAEPIGPAASWAFRRSQYEAWSAEPGWQLLVAADPLRGYAAARITPPSSSRVPVSFRSDWSPGAAGAQPGRAAEVQLPGAVVAPHAAHVPLTHFRQRVGRSRVTQAGDGVPF